MHRLPFLLIVFSLIALPFSPFVITNALAEEAKKGKTAKTENAAFASFGQKRFSTD